MAAFTVTCDNCGFSGSIDRVRVHSCDVQTFDGRCEDFPCCGHQQGECQTTPEMTSEYWLRPENAAHLGCDHPNGFCDADRDAYDDEDDEPDLSYEVQNPALYADSDWFANYIAARRS